MPADVTLTDFFGERSHMDLALRSSLGLFLNQGRKRAGKGTPRHDSEWAHGYASQPSHYYLFYFFHCDYFL